MAAKDRAKTKRRVKNSTYSSFKLQKRIRPKKQKTTPSYKIFQSSLLHIKQHIKIYSQLVLIGFLLNVLLVKGLSSSVNISETVALLQGFFEGVAGSIAISAGVLTLLASSSLSASSDAGFYYQSSLILVLSLAYIWTIRQTYAKKAVKDVRESFYKSTHPLIATLGVLFIIGFQLLPLSLGGYLYGVVIAGGIAVGNAEVFIWLLFIGALALLSFYWIVSSVFAFYIVTLPDTRPVQALKAAGDIVNHRRLKIITKLLFLPFILMILTAVIIVPTIFWAPLVTEWVFYFLSSVWLLVSHSYMYHLYRSLL